MKVILLRDVAKIGRRHEVVNVPDGYALNQLIPKKWAEAATAASLKRIETQKGANIQQQMRDEEVFSTAVAALETTPLRITARQVNDQGHLFKAIHEADVVTAAKSRGIILTSAQIQIPSAIKSLGSHEIILKHKTVSKTITVEIIN